jgi:pyruvate/2-oxoglutarate/acetoin dehydrogenase E1 component
VTTLDVPMQYSANLEQACIPQPDRVVQAVRRVVARGHA